MRIISGTARGRKLSEIPGKNIRPTPDRVREALFSIIASRFGSLGGLKVLELFAGSGAQGLEAVSRGAESAILVDSNTDAAKVIDENIRRCNFEERVRLLQADAFAALPRLRNEGPFDLILLDPPYNRDFLPRVLQQLDTLELLGEDGLICAESASNEPIPDAGKLQCIETRRYGTTAIHLFGRSATED